MLKRNILLLLIIFYFINLPIHAQEHDLKKIIQHLFNKLSSTKEQKFPMPPIDIANISVGTYKPIPATDSRYARDSLHRLNAYQAWKQEDYESVIEELTKVSNKISIDWEFLTKAYIKLNRWEEALNTGTNIQSDDPEILTHLGIIAIVNKKHEIAIEYFEEAIELKKDFYPAYQYLGNVYYLLNKNQEAVNNWQLAQQYGSQGKYLNYFIGVANFKMKNYELAIEYFDKVTNQDSIWYDYSVYYLSHLAIQNDNIRRANEVLNRIIIPTFSLDDLQLDLLMKQIYCNYVLGIQALEKDQKDEALDYFSKAKYLITSHNLKAPEFTYMDITRCILCRLIEENSRNKDTESAYHCFSDIVSDFEIYVSDENKYFDEFKLLGNIIYLFSENEAEKQLAANCFQKIMNENVIYENNYNCIFPNFVNHFYLEKIKSLDCSEITLYLLYNACRILFYKNMFSESRDFISMFKECVKLRPDFKYKNEFLLELLNIEIKLTNKLYGDNPRRVINFVNEIYSQIANIPKQNLKPIPEYILVNENLDLLIIFVI